MREENSTHAAVGAGRRSCVGAPALNVDKKDTYMVLLSGRGAELSFLSFLAPKL